MGFTDFFANLFLSIPHVNFDLKPSGNLFTLDLSSDYVQSLAVISIACITINILLVMTIAIAWICQCCLAEPIIIKNRSSVRQLSTILLSFSVSTCFLLAFSLLGNEQVNRGVVTSIDSMVDVHRHVNLAIRETRKLNDTCQNSTVHFKTLVNWMNRQIREMRKSDKIINQSNLNEVNLLLTTIERQTEETIDSINTMFQYMQDGTLLKSSATYGARIENERWMTSTLLLFICLTVLIVGVFAFCRISKRGIILYASLGMVIFILVWLLIAVIIPSTVALSDFCYNGRTFIKTQMSDSLYELFTYYKNCPENVMKKTVPRFLYISRMTNFLYQMLATAIEANFLLQKIFIDDYTMHNFSSVLIEDAATGLKNIGSVEVQLDCNIFKQDIHNMYDGVCSQAIAGSITMSLCMILLGIILFGILLVVPRTWYIFRNTNNPRLSSISNTDGIKSEFDDFYPPSSTSMLPLELDDNIFKCEPCRDICEKSRNNRLGSMLESTLIT